MNLQKAKPTARKFYNKWLYKVSLSVQGSYLFRQMDMPSLIKYAATTECPPGPPYSFLVKNWPFRHQLGDIAQFIQSKSHVEHSFRVERNIIDFYTNDIDFYNAVSNEFSDAIRMRYAPDLSNLNLLDGQNVIVKKYPHDRYKHRVYLMPHKMARDTESKVRFLDWLKTQDTMTCTPALESWFLATDWNWDRRYILVEDERALLMLKLRGADVVGKIHNFVIADK